MAVQEQYKNKWRVESQSRPGQYYTVSLDKNDQWACSCPHWIYRRTPCKHILDIQMNVYEQSNEMTEEMTP